MKFTLVPSLAIILSVSVSLCRGDTAQRKNRPDIVVDDFESGRYDKWTVEGNAFGKTPLEVIGLDSPLQKSLSDNNWAKVYCPGRQGKFLAYSAPQNNNGPQGKLISRPFAIERRTLTFLIGGGSTSATRMDLRVDGKVVRTASGEDLWGLTERVWDVSEFQGRQGVLEIVDASSGSWGYIAVDRIVLSDSSNSAPWVEDPKDFITLRPVNPGRPWSDSWVKDPNAKLLLMGDSITDHWDGNAFRKYCAGRSYVNLGRSMDQAAHMLWRLDHIDCEGAHAKLIVLMIGSNDGACNFSSQDVAAGVGAVVAKLRTKMPQAKVLLMSILPRGNLPKTRQQALLKINPSLAKLADDKNVFFLDIAEKYLRPDGMVDSALLGDLCHPSTKGYEIWAQAMEPMFKKLLDN